MLKFNKDRTICLSSSGDSSKSAQDENSNTSEDSDCHACESMAELKSNFRQVIIKGLDVSKNVKKVLNNSDADPS